MKRNFWRKAASGLLALTLATGTLPAGTPMPDLFSGAVLTAHAEWTGKSAANTTLGTTGIDAPKAPTADTDAWMGNYVYYGKYDGTNPTKYRVLDPSSTAFGVTGGSLFLDCDTTLYNARFHGRSNVWSSSAVKTGLNGYAFLNKANNFTAIEKGAIAASTKAQKSSTDGDGWDGTLNWAPLEHDTIFLLDAKEATNTSYGYANTDDPDNARKKSGSSNTGWWLRSPNGRNDILAGFVYGSNGHIYYRYVYNDVVGVSPAFNVNLESVIFSSVISDDLTATSGKEYKLTLKDTAFGIGVTTGEYITADRKTITIPYTVTDTDDDLDPDTVSVLIQSTADNSILYYAPLSGTYAASGTGTFTLPDALSLDDWGTEYNVSLLAEDVNRQYETDYASVPVTLDASLIAHDTEVIASGNCGASTNQGGAESVTWSLDSSGKLTISGTGAIKEWTQPDWYEYRDRITNVVIEDGVTKISGVAFGNCTVMTSVTIPNSVESISTCAFLSCTSLTSVIIPDSVKNIKIFAFGQCKALKTVIVERSETLTAIEKSPFSGTPETMTIYVPAAKAEEYKSAENWSDYAPQIVGYSDTQLPDGKYKQTAEKNGTYYTRFVFVVPKTDFAGKSKAKFTATYQDTPYTFETNTYYTGVISNGVTYNPASSGDRAMFVVTVSSGSDISADLTCKLDFE